MSIDTRNQFRESLQSTDFEAVRIEWLLQSLMDCYGNYGPGELDDLIHEGDFSVQRLVEIQAVKRECVTMIDGFDDIIFHDVRVPERVRPYLRPDDQFLATLLMRDGHWHALELLYWAVDPILQEAH